MNSSEMLISYRNCDESAKGLRNLDGAVKVRKMRLNLRVEICIALRNL